MVRYRSKRHWTNRIPTRRRKVVEPKLVRALNRLRQVEIHQEIKWHDKNLKDSFYEVLELLEEVVDGIYGDRS